jgi:hypothetical protein
MCDHETDVWSAVASGRWPDAVDPALSMHVERCASCAEVVAVSSALLADAGAARAESGAPSSAIVWWRAQLRARHEAARAAERPLTVVHALAIACAAGLLLGLIGLAGAWMRDATRALTSAHLPLIDGWAVLPWIVLAVFLLLAPLVYVIVSDE